MTLYSKSTPDLGPLSQTTTLIHLRVLATTDLHATLMPFDYYADKRDDRVGLVRVAGVVEQARAETPNCILLDNGDTFQGGPMGELAVQRMAASDAPHPMILAMNALGYDGATLGNHDFDYGVDILRRVLADAEFPVVLANVEAPGNAEPFQNRHVILQRELQDMEGGWHTIRIGLTGSVPPQVAHWNRSVLNGDLQFCDAVEATARQARQLKAEGADIVVALAHSGLGEAATTSQPSTPGDELGKENVARAIAALEDVDVVIAGHTHDVYPQQGDREIAPPDVPIVQPGFWGSHLGCIDLALVKEAQGKSSTWQLTRAHAEALPLASQSIDPGASSLRRILRAHPDLRRTVGRIHRATRTATAEKIGASRVALTTYFSTLAPCAATQIIADAQRNAAKTALSQVPEYRDLPLLSAVAPMRTGGLAAPDQYTDIPPGPLLNRHVSDLYCYPNNLTVVRLKGRDLVQWLERSASLFRRIDPDAATTQGLIDHAFAGYNFDRIDGLIYDIDVSQEPRTNACGNRVFDTPGRIRNLRFADGTEVDPDAPVLVATNSYRASGGGQFTACADSEVIFADTTPVRDCVADYIKAQGTPITPQPSPTFRLCGFGQARPVFETGPGAMRHAGMLHKLGLTPRGISKDGFLRLDYAPPPPYQNA